MFVDPFFLPHVVAANIYTIGNRHISVMLKNGSSTLHQYAKENNIPIHDVKELFEPVGDKKIVIDVIIRDPVDRYFSALDTVTDIYKLDKTIPTPEKVDFLASNSGIFLDNHYYPQYTFLISSFVQSWCSNNLYFRFIDMSELKELVGDIHSNSRPLSKKYKPNVVEKNIIKQKYYFDMKIYGHLMGQTLNYIELLDFFQEFMEKKYAGQPKLHLPRWIHYLNQISPKNHVDNFQDEIAKYKNVFDNFTSEFEKINKI